jgi:GNAT superfamily N-acetyltransferase
MTVGPAGTHALVQVRFWDGRGRLDEILVLVHAAFAGLEPPSSVLRDTVSDFAHRLQTESALIAQVGDEIVGSVFCACQGDALYLTRMAVAADWRRCGVGSALLRFAADEARRMGGARLTLRVRQSLPDNRSYFERRGFVVTGEGREGDRPPYLSMESVVH